MPRSFTASASITSNLLTATWAATFGSPTSMAKLSREYWHKLNLRLVGCVALGLAVLAALSVQSQSILPFSWLTPGSEWTTIVANGDFQAQGSLAGGRHPNPTGWSGFGEMSADAGTNMVRADNGMVAKGY